MESKKRILLLVNAVSGTKNAVTNLFAMVEELTKRNCLVTVYPVVPERGLMSEDIINFYHAGDYDVIACCGGDGTLNHLINTLMKNNIQCPIGYIPTGSTNDFSRSMNQGKSLTLEEQCAAIANGNTLAYDIGKVNDAYFNYITAFGAFTKVSYSTPQKLKNVLGYGAYMVNLIGNLSEVITYRRHVRYEYDGGSGEGDFVFGAVCNTTSVAGVESPLVKHSSLSDGLFEVIMISAPNNIGEFNRILQKMSTGDTDDKLLIKFTTNRVVFHFDKELNWTLDGEEYSTGTDVVIENCKQTMKLCVE